ncbi:AmmeMemoRadiSam system radical SAM enzyme [Aceticella autotrophica]|uniref:AmmeMemoRadiSam system radical SAM enzyme n=1 Tax=Aceticella autotrophica TaxID=2755338 RepID=A0A975AUP1_9THEO|nr:AmmeMemoRadiSam system radical SAM enzyme [Aceticella autotrophica]QSZ26766.1 AmmeMemoRadiSam system radical SAM enzyme [Aceticella autotrophica]
MKEAMFYEKLDNNTVHCLLCPHDCMIKEGKYGFCNVRKNVNGTLNTENYGIVTAIALDPMEKKPLYHFYPGRYILSVGTFGCNLRCAFCQNWEISQQKLEGNFALPEQLIHIAKSQENNIGIAYTYNEPTIWFEYVIECAKAARENGLKNVLVSNGFINIEPLKELLKYIDAMNIDIKAFTDEYYRKLCYGKLDNVLRTVEVAAKSCHVEITTLLVTGENDNVDEMEKLAKWLSGINKNIPLHFTRYFPHYKMTNPPTPIETLKLVSETGKKYLNYVYTGNAPGFDNNTYCPVCGNLLIERNININIIGIKNNKCLKCGNEFYGFI